MFAGCMQPSTTKLVPELSSNIPAPMVVPATSWFLHTDKTCGESFCNCGSWNQTMNQEKRDSACDDFGRRFTPVPDTQRADGHFAAMSRMPDYPAATRVNGTLFLAADNPETYSIRVSLLLNGIVVGEHNLTAIVPGEPQGQITQHDKWTPVPFDFLTTKAIAGNGTAEFRVTIQSTWSYFVGYNGNHASFLIIGAPHQAATRPSGTPSQL